MSEEIPEINRAITPSLSPTDTTPIVLSVTSAKESDWTCRLPEEIMNMIFDYLVRDKAAKTLARCQRASSSMYTMVTPYLYRHIDIDEYQALKLFRIFGDIDDNRPFSTPVPEGVHPINLNICHRLRSSLSHTEKLTLTMKSFRETAEVLEPYKSLIAGLRTFQYATMWPRLEQMELNMDAWGDRGIIDDHRQLRSPFAVPLAVLSGTRVKNLVVKLPAANLYLDPEVDNDDYRDSLGILADTFRHLWQEVLRGIHAEHIELFNFDSFLASSPTSSESLTIRFSKTPAEYQLETVLNPLIWYTSPSVIKIVGLLSTSSDQWARFDELMRINPYSYDPFKWLRSGPWVASGREEVKIGLVPVSEIENEIEWRTYKAKNPE